MRTTTDILSIPVDAVTPEDALARLLGFLEEDGPRLLVTPNPEMIMLANKDAEFRQIMANAALVTPDGIGVVLASRLNKVKIRRRVTGCDLMEALFAKIAAENIGKMVYLFGAAPGVAAAAAENLAAKYAGLNIVGVHDGYATTEQERAMLDEIKAKKADILVIGLSMGMSEKWAARHADLPVKLMACVGGSIDVWGGNVRRAPKAFRVMGLEWLYRLIRQPSRWRRMLALPVFAFKVICGKLKAAFAVKERQSNPDERDTPKNEG